MSNSQALCAVFIILCPGTKQIIPAMGQWLQTSGKCLQTSIARAEEFPEQAGTQLETTPERSQNGWPGVESCPALRDGLPKGQLGECVVLSSPKAGREPCGRPRGPSHRLSGITGIPDGIVYILQHMLSWPARPSPLPLRA
eukprot:gene12664-biopygen6462